MYNPYLKNLYIQLSLVSLLVGVGLSGLSISNHINKSSESELKLAEVETLESEHRKLLQDLKKSEEIKQKNIKFFETNSHMKFLPIKNELDLFSLKNHFNEIFLKLSEDVKFKWTSNGAKKGHNLYEHKFELTFNYENPNNLIKIINFFNDNFFYTFDSLEYNTETTKFIYKGALYSRTPLEKSYKTGS